MDTIQPIATFLLCSLKATNSTVAAVASKSSHVMEKALEFLQFPNQWDLIEHFSPLSLPWVPLTSPAVTQISLKSFSRIEYIKENKFLSILVKDRSPCSLSNFLILVIKKKAWRFNFSNFWKCKNVVDKLPQHSPTVAPSASSFTTQYQPPWAFIYAAHLLRFSKIPDKNMQFIWVSCLGFVYLS